MCSPHMHHAWVLGKSSEQKNLIRAGASARVYILNKPGEHTACPACSSYRASDSYSLFSSFPNVPGMVSVLPDDFHWSVILIRGIFTHLAGLIDRGCDHAVECFRSYA